MAVSGPWRPPTRLPTCPPPLSVPPMVLCWKICMLRKKHQWCKQHTTHFHHSLSLLDAVPVQKEPEAIQEAHRPAPAATISHHHRLSPMQRNAMQCESTQCKFTQCNAGRAGSGSKSASCLRATTKLKAWGAAIAAPAATLRQVGAATFMRILAAQEHLCRIASMSANCTAPSVSYGLALCVQGMARLGALRQQTRRRMACGPRMRSLQSEVVEEGRGA